MQGHCSFPYCKRDEVLNPLADLAGKEGWKMNVSQETCQFDQTLVRGK